MGQILSFQPAQSELDDAWNAYDSARLRVEALYRDDASTPDQRRTAVIETERLHAVFRRLMARAS